MQLMMARARMNHSPATITYLDSISPLPLAVLSLRKLISTATKSIRVRRSSDNTEQDIGFTGDVLDTSALSSFVGANSAYVTKIYDQKGSFDAVQATNAKQPMIVNAGTYSGLILFNGSSQYMTIPSLTMSTPRLFAFVKMIPPTVGSYRIMFELSSDGTATAGGWAFYQDTGGYNKIVGTGTGKSSVFAQGSVTSLTEYTAWADRTLTGLAETSLRVNGSAISPSSGGTSNPTGNLTTNTFYIGCRAGTSYFSDIQLETLVMYVADATSKIGAIEAII